MEEDGRCLTSWGRVPGGHDLQISHLCMFHLLMLVFMELSSAHPFQALPFPTDPGMGEVNLCYFETGVGTWQV